MSNVLRDMLNKCQVLTTKNEVFSFVVGGNRYWKRGDQCYRRNLSTGELGNCATPEYDQMHQQYRGTKSAPSSSNLTVQAQGNQIHINGTQYDYHGSDADAEKVNKIAKYAPGRALQYAKKHGHVGGRSSAA